MYDFHTHTFLSDGVLAPIELIRRAHVIGYHTIAITDHVGHGNLEFILGALIKDCEIASQRWDILALPGVEITHVPKDDIDLLAKEAKAMGAKLVNVHGETVVEPVEPGTNLASVNSSHVDVLAHPGLITHEEASVAAQTGVFLEISARKGHAFANGHVARMALKTGGKMVLNSDAHTPEDLLTREFAMKVARGAGLPQKSVRALLEDDPRALLAKIGLET